MLKYLFFAAMGTAALSKVQQNRDWRKQLQIRRRSVRRLSVSRLTTAREALGVFRERIPAASTLSIRRQLGLAGGGLGVAVLGVLTGTSLGAVCIPLIFYLGWPYLQEAYENLRYRRRASMAMVDVLFILGLMAIGSWVAIGCMGFLMVFCQAALRRTEARSHQDLSAVFAPGVSTVWVWRDEVEVEIPLAELQQGEVVVVGAGEIIPADGTVLEGVGSVDQRLLTGEGQPVECAVGDPVMASSTLLTGRLRFRVERSGAETTAGRIAVALERSVEYRVELQWRWKAFLDRIATPVLLGGGLAYVLLGPMSALFTIFVAGSLGYAMRIIAPLQLFNYLRFAARELLLIKDGRVFEQLGEIDTVVFDKTGTLTDELPRVGGIHCVDGWDTEQLLMLAAAAEQRLNHPIAQAILAAAQAQHLELPAVQDGSYELGLGIRVALEDGRLVQVGSRRFLSSLGLALTPSQHAIEEQSHHRGANLVWVVVAGQVVGGIELLPGLRPEAPAVVKQLQQMGLQCHILSGDQRAATGYLAERLGISQWFAEVLPEDKAQVIEELKRQGRRVCYVGDGINDSLALLRADVSVSLTGASSIAVDTAQVVMTDRSLGRLPLLIDSGRCFNRTMRHNFLLSSAPLVPMGAGVMVGAVGLTPVIFSYYFGMALGAANALRPPRPGQTLAVLTCTVPEVQRLHQD